jgi:antitoxin HigA-1
LNKLRTFSARFGFRPESGIVNGRARVTADMAIRLAAVFATEAQLWVNLQGQHDLWVASRSRPT